MSNRSDEDELAEIVIKAIEERRPQTVRQLAEFLKEDFLFSEEKLAEYVLKLEREGRIRLKEPVKPIPESFGSYLMTGRARWFWMTILLAAATSFVIFTVPEDMVPLAYIRYVLGTVFVLWLPGYTLTKALFPSHYADSSESLDFTERAGLSIGLSIALVPVVGLLLNYTPWGIRLPPIVLSLLALSTILATTGAIREHQNALESLRHDGLDS